MDRPGMTIVAALLLVLSPSIPAEIDEAEFERLHRELQPDKSEPWRSIPWSISLLGGQAEAVRTGKPLFIWAMDGHPLGCT